MFKKIVLSVLIFLMSFNTATVLAAVDLMQEVLLNTEVSESLEDIETGDNILDKILMTSNEIQEMMYDGVLMQSSDGGLEYELVNQCSSEEGFMDFDSCKEDCKTPKHCVIEEDVCYYCKVIVEVPVVEEAPIVKKPGFFGKILNGIKNVIKKAAVKVKGVFQKKAVRQKQAEEQKIEEEQKKKEEIKQEKHDAQNRLFKYLNREPKSEHDKKEESEIAKGLNESIKNASGINDLFEMGVFVNLFCSETMNGGQYSKECEKLKAALKKRGNEIKEELYAKLQVGNLTPEQIKEINQLLTILSAGDGRYFSAENVVKIKKGINEKAYKALKKQVMQIGDLAELQELFIEVHSMNGLSSNMNIFGEKRESALHVLQHRARRLSMAALLALDICDPDPEKLAALLVKLSNPPGCKELLGMPDVCQALKDGDAHQAYNLMYEHTKGNAEMKGPIDCEGKENPKYTPQSFEDAKNKLKEAIENGDEAEIARLKEILLRRFSESIEDDGFNDLFNDQNKINELCTMSPYKEHFKEECEKMRKALLARGNKIKDEMLKRLKLEGLTDVEIHMIIISLKSGVAQYLDGVLVRGYFSPENVKKALAQIEAALRKMSGMEPKVTETEDKKNNRNNNTDKLSVPEEGGIDMVGDTQSNGVESLKSSESDEKKGDDNSVSQDIKNESSQNSQNKSNDSQSTNENSSQNSQNDSVTNTVTSETDDVLGCMDPNSPTYNPQATQDDGSCVAPPPPMPGCTDPAADNYFPEANIDDGSCIMPGAGEPPAVVDIPGCMDPNSPTYNPQATIEDGSCVPPTPPMPGCTDPAAQNYIPEATENDGSCVY